MYFSQSLNPSLTIHQVLHIWNNHNLPWPWRFKLSQSSGSQSPCLQILLVKQKVYRNRPSLCHFQHWRSLSRRKTNLSRNFQKGSWRGLRYFRMGIWGWRGYWCSWCSWCWYYEGQERHRGSLWSCVVDIWKPRETQCLGPWGSGITVVMQERSSDWSSLSTEMHFANHSLEKTFLIVEHFTHLNLSMKMTDSDPSSMYTG